VSVDGRDLGRVKNEAAMIERYVHVANVVLRVGVHAFGLTYPHSDLTPGSGNDTLTSLSAIVLQPQQRPPSELITVGPRQAARLCVRGWTGSRSSSVPGIHA
jgi:hypothetical protein